MTRTKDAPLHVIEVGNDSLKVDGEEQMHKQQEIPYEGFEDITDDGCELEYLLTCEQCTLESYYYTFQAAKYIADIHGYEHRNHNVRIWESVR